MNEIDSWKLKTKTEGKMLGQGTDRTVQGPDS